MVTYFRAKAEDESCMERKELLWNVLLRQTPKQPCFTIEQVELLLLRAERWAVPMFATLAFTGIRIGELQQLRWEDADFLTAMSSTCIVEEVAAGPKTKRIDSFLSM